MKTKKTDWVHGQRRDRLIIFISGVLIKGILDEDNIVDS